MVSLGVPMYVRPQDLSAQLRLHIFGGGSFNYSQTCRRDSSEFGASWRYPLLSLHDDMSGDISLPEDGWLQSRIAVRPHIAYTLTNGGNRTTALQHDTPKLGSCGIEPNAVRMSDLQGLPHQANLGSAWTRCPSLGSLWPWRRTPDSQGLLRQAILQSPWTGRPTCDPVGLLGQGNPGFEGNECQMSDRQGLLVQANSMSAGDLCAVSDVPGVFDQVQRQSAWQRCTAVPPIDVGPRPESWAAPTQVRGWRQLGQQFAHHGSQKRGGARGGSCTTSRRGSRQDSHAQFPLGDRPVVVHDTRNCKPCVFWFYGCCTHGDKCEYCHIKHPRREYKAVKISRANREKVRIGRMNKRQLQHESARRLEVSPRDFQ